MDPFLIAAWVVIFVFGACIGSFLNVCVSRWPAELSVVRPRSRCPKCETQIAWYDNIPLVSWLVLRAKCRACGNPISAQYPLVELVVGVMWVLAVRGGGRGGGGSGCFTGGHAARRRRVQQLQPGRGNGGHGGFIVEAEHFFLSSLPGV